MADPKKLTPNEIRAQDREEYDAFVRKIQADPYVVDREGFNVSRHARYIPSFEEYVTGHRAGTPRTTDIELPKDVPLTRDKKIRARVIQKLRGQP